MGSCSRGVFEDRVAFLIETVGPNLAYSCDFTRVAQELLGHGNGVYTHVVDDAAPTLLPKPWDMAVVDAKTSGEKLRLT